MKKLVAISILAVMAAGVAGSATAGLNNVAQLAVDVRAKTGTIGCTTIAYSSCSSIQQNRETGTGATDLYVVLYHVAGFLGIEFGLDWDNDYIYPLSWSKCSTVDVTDTSNPHRLSTSLGWGTCQTPSSPWPGTGGMVTVFQRMGASGAGIPTTIHISPSNNGLLQVIDCLVQRDDVHTTHDGYAFQATPPGAIPPCTFEETATEARTWSGVKALYR